MMWTFPEIFIPLSFSSASWATRSSKDADFLNFHATASAFRVSWAARLSLNTHPRSNSSWMIPSSVGIASWLSLKNSKRLLQQNPNKPMHVLLERGSANRYGAQGIALPPQSEMSTLYSHLFP